MNRRHFCKSAFNLGLLSATSSLFSWPVFSLAQDKAPQFIIFLRITGGWDTSLSLDPWTAAVRPAEKDFFVEYRPEELLPYGNSFLGPAMKPLQSYFDRMTVVNGMFLTATDGGHDSASIYTTTGNGQGHLATLPLELEGNLFHSPFGSLSNVAVYNAGKSKNIWDLSLHAGGTELSRADMLIDFDEKPTEFSKARLSMISHSAKINRFNEIFKTFADEKEIGAVMSAFRSGLSYSAFYEISKSLDTHAGHEKTHLTNLTSAFSVVGKFIAALKASPGVQADLSDDANQSLLDQTTVVVTSEFTRTPALNGSGGKDHNPQCNSVLIFSPKMKPTTIGASTLVTRSLSKSGTPYLAGLPLDNVSLKPVQQRQDSFILRPENVIATIAASMGVNPGLISADLAKAKLLSALLK